jgi:hypothetical protein
VAAVLLRVQRLLETDLLCDALTVAAAHARRRSGLPVEAGSSGGGESDGSDEPRGGTDRARRGAWPEEAAKRVLGGWPARGGDGDSSDDDEALAPPRRAAAPPSARQQPAALAVPAPRAAPSPGGGWPRSNSGRSLMR